MTTLQAADEPIECFSSFFIHTFAIVEFKHRFFRIE